MYAGNFLVAAGSDVNQKWNGYSGLPMTAFDETLSISDGATRKKIVVLLLGAGSKTNYENSSCTRLRTIAYTGPRKEIPMGASWFFIMFASYVGNLQTQASNLSILPIYICCFNLSSGIYHFTLYGGK